MRCIRCGGELFETLELKACNCGLRLQRTSDGKLWHKVVRTGERKPWKAVPEGTLLVVDWEEADG